jgi:hypothetical protein
LFPPKVCSSKLQFQESFCSVLPPVWIADFTLVLSWISPSILSYDFSTCLYPSPTTSLDSCSAQTLEYFSVKLCSLRRTVCFSSVPVLPNHSEFVPGIWLADFVYHHERFFFLKNYFSWSSATCCCLIMLENFRLFELIFLKLLK